MDRPQLADFLRKRREALQPEDVGLTRGRRRRTAGLRREEVAALSDMSVDYYSRLEQQRGPQPSEQMLAALARGLRLTLAERDHLFRLAGHTAPERRGQSDHVSPGLMRVLDRLADTPAQIMSALGETLAQTPPARVLFGDETRFDGPWRSIGYRWFLHPPTRDVYPEADHPRHSRAFTADIRAVYAQHGATSRAGALVAELLARSPEFAELWEQHELRDHHTLDKRLQHPETGVIEAQCQVLVDPDTGQSLLVITAQPGTESYDRLKLLAVIGTQRMTADVE
ncbi:MAG: helix-turn-helix transcriptional regulator [Candidatus Microbacterium phytovorans]|uniref:Helix-turn-helix transcriptional regulator n=1 Tax=Candidatus Microbacterium phytovorans TaxID=3121374 RepID=A0AAJ5VZA2_9MICO|nr:helix-turn-helix transcriptional regulator [Microbacterium sp.]WEK13136.1 MAG: helix-turn-helix transcriptional regulator [Microbacterium sp.]